MTPVEAKQLIELWDSYKARGELTPVEQTKLNRLMESMVTQLMFRELVVKAYQRLGQTPPRSLV